MVQCLGRRLHVLLNRRQKSAAALRQPMYPRAPYMFLIHLLTRPQPARATLPHQPEYQPHPHTSPPSPRGSATVSTTTTTAATTTKNTNNDARTMISSTSYLKHNSYQDSTYCYFTSRLFGPGTAICSDLLLRTRNL